MNKYNTNSRAQSQVDILKSRNVPPLLQVHHFLMTNIFILKPYANDHQNDISTVMCGIAFPGGWSAGGRQLRKKSHPPQTKLTNKDLLKLYLKERWSA